jgi:hypothetical protein
MAFHRLDHVDPDKHEPERTETDVWAVADGRPIWTGVGVEYQRASVDGIIQEFAIAVVPELRRRGVIP